MRLQIGRKSLLITFILTLLYFSFFFPSSRVTSLITLVRYSSLIAGVAVLLITINWRIQYKNNKYLFFWFPIIYYVYILIISSINGMDYANADTISAIIQFFVIIALFSRLWKDNSKLANDVIFWIYFIFVLWDFIDIISHPGGGMGYVQWIFGNKNNHTLYYFILLYTSFVRCKTRKTLISKATLLSVALIITYATLYMGSSTSIASIMIADLAVLGFMFYKGRAHIKGIFILVGSIILNVIVVIGQTGFLSGIVAAFGKDLTFSERTIAWVNSFKLIVQKPVYGWGMIHGTYAKHIIGYNNSHNQLIDCLVSGGIILLIFFIVILINLSKRIDRIPSNNERIFHELFLIAMLVKMVFEQIIADYMFWILLILMMSEMFVHAQQDLDKF